MNSSRISRIYSAILSRAEFSWFTRRETKDSSTWSSWTSNEIHFVRGTLRIEEPIVMSIRESETRFLERFLEALYLIIGGIGKCLVSNAFLSCLSSFLRELLETFEYWSILKKKIAHF